VSDWVRVDDTVKVSVGWLARLRAGGCDVSAMTGTGQVLDVERSVEHGWRSVLVRFADVERTVDESDLEPVVA
jgi:post-segregation antitoxin (ccd killing protein)